MMPPLPIDAILAARTTTPPSGRELGRSREGRPIVGHQFGQGPLSISLIAGCHADEPVGPAMLERMIAHLACQQPHSPLLTAATWRIVAHANPDGEIANRPWTDRVVTFRDQQGRSQQGYDLVRYLRHIRREAPGDDMEFGFPRTADPSQDMGARPENRAIAAFLEDGAPLALHASFHGMAFAAGPWFLLERAWIDRTTSHRDTIRERVRALGYRLHDVDRGGEKGFDRIDTGFTTRPDSRAMAEHFRARGDEAMASHFRPSSMELARRLGGDPLTLVSEMPLFLLDPVHYRGDQVYPAVISDLQRHVATGDMDALRQAADDAGIVAMPLGDQMRLQLVYLDIALRAVIEQRQA